MLLGGVVDLLLLIAVVVILVLVNQNEEKVGTCTGPMCPINCDVQCTQPSCRCKSEMFRYPNGTCGKVKYAVVILLFTENVQAGAIQRSICNVFSTTPIADTLLGIQVSKFSAEKYSNASKAEVDFAFPINSNLDKW